MGTDFQGSCQSALLTIILYCTIKTVLQTVVYGADWNGTIGLTTAIFSSS